MRGKGTTDMKNLKVSAALVLITPFLAACGPNNGISPYRNPSLNSANQPIVQRSDYVLDLGTSGSGLAPSEATRLSQWFASLGLRYGDRVFLDGSAGYVDTASRADVARIAGAYGLLLSEGAPVTAGTVQPGSVRVVVSRTEASVPGCPNWEKGELNVRTATTSPNYGCAINSNLAAMIADPNDLVLGQTDSGSADAQAANKAVKAYRDRVPTGASGEVKVEKTGSN